MSYASFTTSRAEALAQAAADWLDRTCKERTEATRLTLAASNSFTREAIDEAIECAMARLLRKDLLEWTGDFSRGRGRKVAVLNAGNVPLVGLQDLLAVVLTGNSYLGVTSRKSPHLLPAFAASIRRHDPGVEISFVTFDGACSQADALIATGQTATVQLISKRFVESGIPRERQLLRGTRFGMALLDGKETDEDLFGLARDALLHEGRGCRNVAIVYAPASLDPDRFVEQARRFRRAFPAHPTTVVGFDRAVRFLEAVEEPYLSGDGFVVVENDVALREPCVLRWVRYRDAREPKDWLERNESRLQVVVGHEATSRFLGNRVERCDFGHSQDPRLDWRPDGVDTMAFLRSSAVTGF